VGGVVGGGPSLGVWLLVALLAMGSAAGLQLLLIVEHSLGGGRQGCPAPHCPSPDALVPFELRFFVRSPMCTALHDGLQGLGVHCDEVPRNCQTPDCSGHCHFGCARGYKQVGPRAWSFRVVQAQLAERVWRWLGYCWIIRPSAAPVPVLSLQQCHCPHAKTCPAQRSHSTHFRLPASLPFSRPACRTP